MMQLVEKEKILDDNEINKGDIYIDNGFNQIYFKCFICNKSLHFPLHYWKIIQDQGKISISPFIPCYKCKSNYVIKNSNIIVYSDKLFKEKKEELMG